MLLYEDGQREARARGQHAQDANRSRISSRAEVLDSTQAIVVAMLPRSDPRSALPRPPFGGCTRSLSRGFMKNESSVAATNMAPGMANTSESSLHAVTLGTPAPTPGRGGALAPHAPNMLGGVKLRHGKSMRPKHHAATVKPVVSLGSTKGLNPVCTTV